MRTTAIFIFTLLAWGAALTAPDSLAQPCPPGIDPACATGLPCPYPAARVTTAHQQAIIAKGGPWHLNAKAGEPLPGMKRTYATAEDWRRDAWGRPADFVYDKTYCRDPSTCGITVENAAVTVLKVVKPNSEAGPCVSHTGNHAMAKAAWTYIYDGHPTLGQWVELECRKDLGGHWVVDAALDKARQCDQGGGPPPEPPPAPPPPPPVPVPQPPPPSGPPPCTPYGGSPCQEHCDKLRARDGPTWTPEACLASPGGVIAAKCANTCPPEPDEPDQPEPEEERLCIPVEVEDGGIFVPGIPSTGRLELELIPCVTVVPLVEGGSS